MGKPAFDPNKPFEAAGEAKPAFDPGKPFEEVKETPARDTMNKPTAVESALSGAVQGATLGFGDELYGGLMGGIKKLARKGDFSTNYEKYRDQNRESNKKAAAENPGSYFGGNLAGGLVSTAFVPGAGALKGAGILKTAAQGAALGGITGAGASEANPLKSPDQLAEFGGDVLSGAAIGGALSGAGAAIGKGIKALAPDSLREYANKRALSAAGFMSKDIKKLTPQQQQDIGRALLDEKVVTALSSLDDVAERATAGKEAAGEAIGKALSTVDGHVKELVAGIDTGKLLQGATDEQKAIAKKYIADNFQFNMRNVGQRIREELVTPNLDNPLVTNELGKLQKIANGFSGKTAEGGAVELRVPKSLEFGNLIKSTQGKQTRFQSETVPEEFKKDVYRIIKEEIENSVGKTGSLEAGLSKLTTLAGGPKAIGNTSDIASRNAAALSNYKDAKGLYGAMKATERAATDSLGRTNANRTFGLTDTIAGVGGLASGGGPTAAIALGTLNKLGRKYGASLQAVGANNLATAVEAVQGVTTDKLAQAIGSAASKSPALAKRVGGAIAKAATEGKSSLVAVHYALMKDPEYRAAMEGGQPDNAFQRRLNQK